MIFRKIEKRLEQFYSDNGKYALLIDGARQVGKTFIVEAFGRSHYESVVKIDFVKMKGAVKLFENVEDDIRNRRAAAHVAQLLRRCGVAIRSGCFRAGAELGAADQRKNMV